jgi:hypothetical protein
MISRKTAMTLAAAFAKKFSSSGTKYRNPGVRRDDLYDFLFEFDHEPWFCNDAKKLLTSRELKEWLMRLHTGETQAQATPNWSWEQRQALGQKYLHDLAEDFLRWYSAQNEDWHVAYYGAVETILRRALELDGYVFRNGTLLYPEADILNVAEEVGVLERLHEDLSLANRSVAFEALRLSDEHYHAGRWSDSIANSRKFLESILQEIARRYSFIDAGGELSEAAYSRPVAIREYLEQRGLIEKREREAIDKIYGLLSHTGSHPYMAESDQARLLRQISLTLSQFAMLRLEGAMKQRAKS